MNPKPANNTHGEIATKLTLISVALMTIGLFFGLNAKRVSTNTYASTTCAYTFGAPILTQTEGKLICTVPTSSENISTIGCSLAKNDQWVADSKFLNYEGSSVRFELTVQDGNGSGTYDLIAYEFDQNCSHEDKVVQVVVDSIPMPTNTPAVTQATKSSPTPTPIPACVLESAGSCMSQALCRAGELNVEVGDLGCSALRDDWVCCNTNGTTTQNETSTDTPTPTTQEPTNTPIPPTDTPPETSVTNASSNVSVTTKTCTKQVDIVSNNTQSWAYRINDNGIYEIVPVAGTKDKQQVVNTVCN